MKRHIFGAAVAALLLLAPPVFAQSGKKPSVGTIGANQVAGGNGLFGTTYSVGDNGAKYNLTVIGAEYSVARYNPGGAGPLLPNPDQKLLIVHFRVQNSNTSDEYVSGDSFKFSTVGMDDQTRNDCTACRLATSKKELDNTMKPGQKLPDDLVVACTVPAAGPVPKLILNLGRIGTNDRIMRFYLGKAPNTVKPLLAPYADPADPSGATARAEIPAKIGVAYNAGTYDLQLVSVAYVPGPIGNTSAGDGNQLLVATVNVTNKSWRSPYTNEFLKAKLTTDDDEKTEQFTWLKGKRDEPYEGRNMDPDEVMQVRLAFVVPTKAKGTKLQIMEVTENSAGVSHALDYDLGGLPSH